MIGREGLEGEIEEGREEERDWDGETGGGGGRMQGKKD